MKPLRPLYPIRFTVKHRPTGHAIHSGVRWQRAFSVSRAIGAVYQKLSSEYQGRDVNINTWWDARL